MRPTASSARLALLPAALVLAACGGSSSSAEDTAPVAEASVIIESPADGAEITGPVEVDMAATGVTIEPAGEVRPDAGHLHIMVDVGCVEPGEVIPSDGQHLHYGDGSTSAELDLPPGEHTLCLQAGDGAHVALDLTDTVTITVLP